MTVAPPGTTARIFPAKAHTGLQAALFLTGGILFFLVLIGIFLLALAMPARQNSGPDMMPGIIGGASVIGIGLLGRGIFLLKSLQRAVIDDAGIHLQGFISRSTIRWQEIDKLQRDKQTGLMGGKTIEVLKIIGAGGKTLATIPDTLIDFPGLVAEIEARSSAVRGTSTYDPAADEQRKVTSDAKKQKWIAIAFGIFAILMAVMFCVGLNEEIHLRRYATDSERVDATVVRRWMVRVTPRIEYRFTDLQGQEHRREVMVTQPAFDKLEDQNTVPIEYLRSDPEWNRPIFGEDDPHSFGGKFLFIVGGGLLMFGSLAVLAGLGYDLKSENGTTRLVRRGRTIKEFGRPAKTPTQPFPISQPETSTIPPMTVAPILAAPVAPAKPKGLIALGILCIAFGLIELALVGFRALLWSQQAITLPDGRIIDTSVERWMHWWNGLDGLLALLLIVTGVQLLRLKPSARTLGRIVALLQILSCAATTALIIIRAVHAPDTHGPESTAAVAGQFGAVLVQLIAMIFPIVLLTILSRKQTAEALAPPV